MAAKVSLNKPDATPSKAAPAASETTAPVRANGLTYVQDAKGRNLGFRKLDALLKFRMRRLAGPEDARNFAVMIDIFSAAVVADIDGNLEPPPLSMRQVEALIVQLGNEGMDAAGAFVLNEIGLSQEVLDEAKNLQTTPS